jgi:hypothetical protein
MGRGMVEDCILAATIGDLLPELNIAILAPFCNFLKHILAGRSISSTVYIVTRNTCTVPFKGQYCGSRKQEELYLNLKVIFFMQSEKCTFYKIMRSRDHSGDNMMIKTYIKEGCH